MSDENRNDAGQFANTPESAFGKEAIERDAGYVPFKEEPAGDADDAAELTVADAAEKLTNSRTSEANIKTYSPITGYLPENVTLTPEQAAKQLSDGKEADALQSDLEAKEKIRKEVDELRGDTPEAKAAKAEAAKADAPIGLDPKADVERFLAIPHVKETFERMTTENETVRQNYSQAVDVANEMARASFIEGFPEIAALPLDQWVDALGAIAQREPDRFNRAVSSLQRVVQLQEAQQVQQQRAEQDRQTKLKSYVKAESGRFESMIADVPKAQRAEIESGIVEAIKEYGGDGYDLNEFIGLMQRSEFGSALAQRLLFDVGKLRMIQKAKISATRAPLPPVVRPGAAAPRQSGNSVNIAALEAKFSKATTATQQIKIAAEIRTAQRKARG